MPIPYDEDDKNYLLTLEPTMITGDEEDDYELYNIDEDFDTED